MTALYDIIIGVAIGVPIGGVISEWARRMHMDDR